MDHWKNHRKMLLCLTFIVGIGFGCAPTLEKRFGSWTDNEVFEQGKALYDQGRYKQALDYFLYVKEHFIRSQYAGPARFYAGQSYLANEDYAEAATEYESFLLFFSEAPLAPEARLNLGICYFEQAKGPERDQEMLHKALEEFETITENYADQDVYVQKAHEYIQKIRTELARHEYSVAIFYRKEKHYAASNRRLNYLIQEYPESDLLIDAWFMQGLNYLDLEQPKEAASAFWQVLEINPAHPLASDARQQLEELGLATPQGSASAVLETSTESIPESPIEGTILTLRNTTVTTDLLSTDGISEGMQLRVYRQNVEVGIIRITAIYAGFSIAEIESLTPRMLIQEDDRVCCPL